MASARLAACLSALLAAADGFRVMGAAGDELVELSAAGAALPAVVPDCTWRTSCSSCLATSPWTGSWEGVSGSYCQWCPAEKWVGDGSDLKGNPGICVAGWTSRADKCGGFGWYHAFASMAGTRTPMVAANRSAAAEFCPVRHAPSVPSLERMSAADLRSMLNDTVELTGLLGSFNIDAERLAILRGVNPVLFDAKFVPTYMGTAATWAWKVGVWSTSFIPASFAHELEFALGITSEVAEEAMHMAQERGESQRALVSQGSAADLSYFTDVTFGKLLSAYEAVNRMSDEMVVEQFENITTSGLAGEGGKVVGHVHHWTKSGYAAAGKAAVTIGLFVGGFFTGGITWTISTVLAGAIIVGSASTDVTVHQAVVMKMKMLAIMARMEDASLWRESDSEVCQITAWYEGRNPCPPRTVPGVEDPMRRVCGRFSPWGNQLGVISGWPGDPEGRCQPAVEPQLAVGMPCLTHSSCSSGFCYFEPSIQYFLSNHTRRHCAPGELGCFSALEQLVTLESADPVLPDEPRDSRQQVEMRQVAQIYDSYDGVVGATTGTCAVACPARKVGKGDCEPLTHRPSSKGKQGTQAPFGIRRKGWQLFAGGEGFSRVGSGDCAMALGPLAAISTHGLQSMGAQRYKECAQLCAKHNLSSFSVYHADASCSLFAQSAWKTEPRNGTVCFTRRAPWPLNVYQPWNVEWGEYKLHLAQIISFIDEGKGLSEVRWAYKDYCTVKETSWFWSDDSLRPLNADESDCPFPATWDKEQAKRMLLSDAPLSASQLQELHSQLSPESMNATVLTGSHDEVLTVAELAERPNGFGEAWLRLLAGRNLNSEGMSRALAERLEIIAEEGDMRVAAEEGDLWDLAAAGEIYMQEMGELPMTSR